MTEQEAQEVRAALDVEMSGYEWRAHRERGEWRVYGYAMDPYRSIEVRRGVVAPYLAYATLQSVEHDSWCGSADTPAAAILEATASFGGRWEDAALHRQHMLTLLRERRAGILSDLEECDLAIKNLESEVGK